MPARLAWSSCTEPVRRSAGLSPSYRRRGDRHRARARGVSSTTRPTTRRGRSSRTRRRSTTRHRHARAVVLAGADAAARSSSATPASPDPWDVDSRTNAVDRSRPRGNNAFAVHNWFSNDPFTRRHRAGDRRGRTATTTYPWTNQWHAQRCNPAVFDVGAAQRHRRRAGEPVRDAQPDARLGVPARLHRGRPGTCRTFNVRPRRRWRTTPSRATRRPAASSAARRRSRRATTRTSSRRATASQPITNMYLWQPIAASFYAPCVDGDYDMSVIAHEYTHAISNRMVGRPERRAVGQPGAGDGRELVGPRRRRVPATRTATSRPAARTAFAVGPYVTGDHERRHPQLRDEQQPAQLLRRRLRLRRRCRSTRSTARSGARPTSTSAQAFDRTATAPATPALQMSCASGRHAGDRVPGQPALDPARCSTRAC